MTQNTSAGSGSLQVRVLLILFVTVTVVSLAFGVYDFSSRKKELTADLNDRAAEISARLKINLVAPLWDFDESAALSVLNGEMGARALADAVVFKEDGKSVFAALVRDDKWATAPVTEAPKIPSDFIVAQGDIVRGEKKAGSFAIALTPKFMEQELNQLLVATAIRVVLLAGIIVVALLMYLRTNIIKPLLLLQDFAARVDQGNLECVMGEGRFICELRLLKNSLEQMVCTLSEKMGEVKDKQAEAERQSQAARQAANEADEARHAAERAKSEGMLQAAQTLESIVDRVVRSSGEISAQVDEVSRNASRQAEQVTETATAMEEMNATVLEVARNAGDTSAQAQQVSVRADEGATIVQKTSATINSVMEKANNLTRNMQDLGGRAEDIGKILNVISDIADQTNLLALNAAIEAARAGDAGRGFAVVADEVRKLAEKTMTATKEVGDAIKAIQSGTHQSMAITTETVDGVREATDMAKQSGEALATILNLANHTTSQIASIATAAEQQSATSEEINRRVEEINQITQGTTEGMVAAASAVGELTEQISQIKRLIEELKAS